MFDQNVLINFEPSLSLTSLPVACSLPSQETLHKTWLNPCFNHNNFFLWTLQFTVSVRHYPDQHVINPSITQAKNTDIQSQIVIILLRNTVIIIWDIVCKR